MLMDWIRRRKVGRVKRYAGAVPQPHHFDFIFFNPDWRGLKVDQSDNKYQSFNHSTNKSFNHSTNQPINHSTIQPINHSINQDSNQMTLNSGLESNEICKERIDFGDESNLDSQTFLKTSKPSINHINYTDHSHNNHTNHHNHTNHTNQNHTNHIDFYHQSSCTFPPTPTRHNTNKITDQPHFNFSDRILRKLISSNDTTNDPRSHSMTLPKTPNNETTRPETESSFQRIKNRFSRSISNFSRRHSKRITSFFEEEKGTDGRMKGRMDGRMDGNVDECKDGRTDGRMNGMADGKMDRNKKEKNIKRNETKQIRSENMHTKVKNEMILRNPKTSQSQERIESCRKEEEGMAGGRICSVMFGNVCEKKNPLSTSLYDNLPFEQQQARQTQQTNNSHNEYVFCYNKDNNTAHNNTAHNNTAHNNTTHNNTAHKNTAHNNKHNTTENSFNFDTKKYMITPQQTMLQPQEPQKQKLFESHFTFKETNNHFDTFSRQFSDHFNNYFCQTPQDEDVLENSLKSDEVDFPLENNNKLTNYNNNCNNNNCNNFNNFSNNNCNNFSNNNCNNNNSFLNCNNNNSLKLNEDDNYCCDFDVPSNANILPNNNNILRNNNNSHFINKNNDNTNNNIYNKNTNNSNRSNNITPSSNTHLSNFPKLPPKIYKSRSLPKRKKLRQLRCSEPITHSSSVHPSTAHPFLYSSTNHPSFHSSPHLSSRSISKSTPFTIPLSLSHLPKPVATKCQEFCRRVDSLTFDYLPMNKPNKHTNLSICP